MVQPLDEIKLLPTSKRLELVDQILQSIGDTEISPKFKTELVRRGTEMKANKKIGRKWSQVRQGPPKTKA
jgi:hypothetical protein